MKSGTKWAVAAAVVLVAAAVAAWQLDASGEAVLAQRYPLPARPLALTPAPQMAAEGERLVRLNGCTSCHGEQLTGQVAMTGWFGTVLTAPNLTTLAHKWSADQLAAAMRYGVTPQGHAVLAMPAHRFLAESDADNAAMIAYLQSLPPRPDSAPPTHWAFGGKAILAMGLIPAVAGHLDSVARGPLTTPTAPMALGRYLTHTQCAACHGSDLSGEAEEHSPDLRFAIVHYSLPAFEHFFRTGIGRLGHGTQTMTPLIKSRLHALTQDEVKAIFLYLNHSKPGGGT